MKEDRLQIYQARSAFLGRKQWRARVVAANGKKLFASSEGYNNLPELLTVTERLFPHLQPEGA